jgi:hypothetical protein
VLACIIKIFFQNHVGTFSFVSISAKLGICTVVGLNGALVEAKIRTLECQVRILASISVHCLFRSTTVQMPNLVLVEKKRIIVLRSFCTDGLQTDDNCR